MLLLSAAVETPRRRRPKGEARRLILESASELFNRKGYSSTSTREIAEHAAVSETLIFRYFGTKAALFREAMVRPFVEVIDEWIARRSSLPVRGDLSKADTREFIGDLYDVFRDHRALAALLFAADALGESELSETGALDEVRDAIDRWVVLVRDEAAAGGIPMTPRAHDLAIRSHLAMVAGAATFGPWYFGQRRPSRKAIVDELAEWVWARYGSELNR